MKPHAVYISPRWPWPPRSGRDLMIRQTLRALAEEFSITYVFIGPRAGNRTPPFDVADVVYLNRPSLREIMWNCISRRDLCLQERLFFSTTNLKYIINICCSRGSSAIIADMIRMSPYLEAHHALEGILRICDMDDLLSKRYKQLSKIRAENYNPFGTFANERLFRILNTIMRPFLQHALQMESRLIEHREVSVMRAVDLVLLVSPVEAADLSAKNNGNAMVMGFPPAMNVYFNNINLSNKRDIAKENNVITLTFIGDMRTPANILAIKLIFGDILPALRAADVVYRMLVVGKADSETSQMINDTPDACYLGWVDDLSNVYLETDIVLCPFVIGSGIKLKVLEGMAYAKPVVTNSLGAEGIAAHAGSEFFVADSRDRVVDAIIELAKNEGLRRNVGAAAASFIAEQHDPHNLQRKLKNAIHNKLYSERNDSLLTRAT